MIFAFGGTEIESKSKLKSDHWNLRSIDPCKEEENGSE